MHRLKEAPPLHLLVFPLHLWTPDPSPPFPREVEKGRMR